MEHAIVKNILRDYNLGSLEKIDELSPGYANRSYRLETDQGVFLFRWILEKGIEDLHTEISLLNALKVIDYPTAYPINRADGNYITHSAQGFVVLYDFIAGKQPGLSETVGEAIGEAVGRLSSFEPPDRFRRKNTITIVQNIDLSESLSMAPYQYPDIYDFFREQTDYLSNGIELGLPMGLIHADVFPDNTIFNGDQLKGIIDFEEACWDELLFDLAMTINGFCFPENNLSLPLLTSLVQGYSNNRKLSPEEWDALPIYIQWTAHGMLSWHLSRLSQQANPRQEYRIRELMSRVIVLRKQENSLSEFFRSIQETALRAH